MRRIAALAVAALALCGQSAWIPAPRPGGAEDSLAMLAPVVGAAQNALIEPGDTLLDVAYRHRLGFDRVARLNPDTQVWIPDPGTVVRLPTEHVLPDAPHRGLVVNVPEMQLYDYTVGEVPEVFAIAIGDEMDPSLVGEFRVGRKRARPVWHVPASIRAEKPELPALVPPGPDNPLGEHWMTIGRTSYGIHGTNNPWSIGREATHGCIRLYEDEVARLFARTREGTPLRLVYQTVKIGRRGAIVYVEAHPDLYGREPERMAAAFERIWTLGLPDLVDPLLVRRVIEEARGIPVAVGSAFGAGHLPDLTGRERPAPSWP
jgi:L,D-transpeptidase ErfK/SrfK